MSIGMCFGSGRYDGDDFWTVLEQSNKIKSLTKVLQEYQEKEVAIKELTGFDLDDLIRLFAAGYTLTQPVYTTLSDAFKPKKG